MNNRIASSHFCEATIASLYATLQK